mgnify:CR=1 FL=1
MAKLMQVIFLMVLGAFLVSSSGLVLHKHYCSIEGVTVSWNPFSGHQCQHEAQKKEASKCVTSCCARNEKGANNKVPNVEKSCCFDEFNVLSLDIDLGTNNQKLIIDCDIHLVESIVPFIQLRNFNPVAFQQRPPPVLSLDYLALFQQYLI